ncbi:uncharacterized protein VTP21DRAFT_8638 [Calcarisporiella thermophila]|uniref:uncharacterized protein n=1 Tax=Calcarisporiella thermophila TaxID=911321 RepID=UPI00374384BC
MKPIAPKDHREFLTELPFAITFVGVLRDKKKVEVPVWEPRPLVLVQTVINECNSGVLDEIKDISERIGVEDNNDTLLQKFEEAYWLKEHRIYRQHLPH